MGSRRGILLNQFTRVFVDEDLVMQTVATTISDTLESRGTLAVPPRREGSLSRLAGAIRARPDLRNGALSLFDQALVSGTSFLTSVIIGRLGSKEEFGIFYVALTIVYLARGIQEQLVSAPYVVYCHGRRDEARALYAGSSLMHCLGLSAVLAVVLLAILGLLSVGIGPAGLSPAIWVLL